MNAVMQFSDRLYNAGLSLTFQPAGVMQIPEVESVLHMCYGLSIIRNTHRRGNTSGSGKVRENNR